MAEFSSHSSFNVSVIIPVYNGEEHIQRAIESVLNQKIKAFEIIVVDDGSTDQTSECVKKFGDTVNYIYQENSGVAAARNTGIKNANGQWISFLDSDDFWLPHRLIATYKVLSDNPSLIWCCGSYYVQFKKEYKKIVALKNRPKKENGKSFVIGFYLEYYYGFIFHTCGFTIRKDILELLGGFDERLTTSEDKDMWYRIADRYPNIGFVQDPFFVYQRRNNSLTTVSKSFTNTMLVMIEKHIPKGIPYPAGLSKNKARLMKKEVYNVTKHAVRVADKNCLKILFRDYVSFMNKQAYLIGIIGLNIPIRFLLVIMGMLHKLKVFSEERF